MVGIHQTSNKHKKCRSVRDIFIRRIHADRNWIRTRVNENHIRNDKINVVEILPKRDMSL